MSSDLASPRVTFRSLGDQVIPEQSEINGAFGERSLQFLGDLRALHLELLQGLKICKRTIITCVFEEEIDSAR